MCPPSLSLSLSLSLSPTPLPPFLRSTAADVAAPEGVQSEDGGEDTRDREAGGRPCRGGQGHRHEGQQRLQRFPHALQHTVCGECKSLSPSLPHSTS